VLDDWYLLGLLVYLYFYLSVYKFKLVVVGDKNENGGKDGEERRKKDIVQLTFIGSNGSSSVAFFFVGRGFSTQRTKER